jgi:hypothetical protein
MVNRFLSDRTVAVVQQSQQESFALPIGLSADVDAMRAPGRVSELL